MKDCLRTGLAVACALISLVMTAWAADVELDGNILVVGPVTANSFSGSGAGLTNIPGNALSSTYQLPQSCASGQFPKWNGTSWACGYDSGGTVTGVYGIGAISVASMGPDEYVSIASSGITSGMLAPNSVNASHIAFYSKVAIVAPTGGDYSDPATAMASYSSWCGTPSSSNPCLLKIMPGFYNIGTNSVTMHSYIDIEGSGENVTVVQGSIDNASAGVIVINGTYNSELRFLTVSNVGGTNHTNALAIYTIYGSQKLTNVTVNAQGALNNYGVYNNQAYPTIINSTISIYATVTNGYSYGIFNTVSSAPTVRNSVVNSYNGMAPGVSCYGIYNTSAGTATVEHSVVHGDTNSLYDNSGGIFNVAYSRLEGAVFINSGTFRCVGAYNSSYVALNSTCQ